MPVAFLSQVSGVTYCFLEQPRFVLPEPPNFTMSWQLVHVPQSFNWQISHIPHRDFLAT